MASTSTTRSSMALVLLCLAFSGASASAGGHVRGASAARTVSTDNVESSLRQTLEAVLRGGNDGVTQRLAAIESSMWQTFQALPKNDMGRLAPRAVRYIVHNYFAKEHGWLIKGLEPHGMQSNVSDVHEVSILQDRAPALVEALLEARQSDRGLALNDVVVMAAVLEQLIFEESVALLKASYSLNGLSSSEALHGNEALEVLTSYLLVFEMGVRGNLTDTALHQAVKAHAAKAGGSWPALVEYGQDALLNYGYARQHAANPFLERTWTFDETSDVVEVLAEGYGKWQNSECRRMKEDLMDMSPEGSGRVPLSSFYSQPENSDYQFTETTEYLREIGALDESIPGAPSVRIANYLAGPTNCIASSTYYSVCCLSECEILLNELEQSIRAPTTSPKHLADLVANLSSSTVDAPRQLSHEMVGRLDAIAERHGGEVPLHGRLFAEWLHRAFPNECPFPHVAENSATLSPSHWLERKTTADADERSAQAAMATPDAESPAAVAVAAAAWSELEVLPVVEAPAPRRGGLLRSGARLATQLAVLLVALRLAGSWGSTALRACGVNLGKKEKVDEWVLPM